MIHIGRICWTVIVVAILALAWLRPMDRHARDQVDLGFQRAAVTYGTARLLHGAVSVMQGTQVNAEPAGVGATFTPGQVLDMCGLFCVTNGLQQQLVPSRSSSAPS